MTAFPKAFLWGATLSAHQVEGCDFNSDWWRWEQRAARIRGGATSEVAAGHYDRFDADFALARKLGLNALLITLSWGRIQPAPGSFDTAALDHYADVFRALRANGLEPICALQHVTVPEWFGARVGWEHAQAAVNFAAYAKRVAVVLGPLCRWWIPILEPEYWLTQAHLRRVWPAARRGPLGYRRAAAQLVHAHRCAAQAIRAVRQDARVGASVRAGVFLPADEDSAWDLRAARREQRRWNDRYLCAITDAGGGYDFIGLSYYGGYAVSIAPFWPRAGFMRLTKLKEPAAGAEVTPAAHLRNVLAGVQDRSVPILLTGCGLAADDDTARCRHLLRHLNVVAECLRGGAEIQGYFHRAFLDGFEWTQGYTQRYGLVHVDRKSLARTPNKSAFLYKDIIESGRIREGAAARFLPKEKRTRQEAPQ